MRWGERWIYIYLLLEFQSRPDRHMAVRMLAYVSLLYQDLIRSGRFQTGLPPVLPIVLYNGARPWRAAKDIESLILAGPPEFAPYRPQAQYLLIEERQHQSAKPDNLVSALFRLEHSRTRDDMKDALDALIARLPSDAQSGLRRTFSAWLEDSIMPRIQGGPIDKLKDLKEIRSMLSETIQRWKMEFKREGLRAGRKKGLEKGLEKGRQEGLQRGLQKGLRQGKQQALLQLLQKRFGEQPDRIQQRIRRARLKQLDAWVERVLDAPSVDALIGSRSARAR